MKDGSWKTELEKQVQTVKARDSLVGFIGGPPCPDFSVAGKNKGSKGDNGRLTKSYVSIIVENKPDFFMFENVKGLVRTKKHKHFYEEMKKILANADYILVDKILNSIQFGVPQDRDRIILFGIRKELLEKGTTSRKQDQVTATFNWEMFAKYSKSILELEAWPLQSPFKEKGSMEKPEKVPEVLTVEYWFKKNDVLKHLNSKDYFQPKSPKFSSINEGDVSRKSFKRLHRWRYSPTVAYGNNEVHLHPYIARRLSVSEALAIQSLPKAFTLPAKMPLSDKFKTIGNGVPYLMSVGLAKTIDAFLNQLK